MNEIKASELVINPDGSIYHLKLKPENIADTILLVGDPGRVKLISSFWDSIEFTVQNREFITHTGIYKGKRISAISTGIGTDNIDIVVNELDALVNIDLEKREIKKEHTSLNLIRLGTSGGLIADLGVDVFLASEYSIGFDGLLNFYKDRDKATVSEIENSFVKFANWNPILATPYVAKASDILLEKIADGIRRGITISAPGFYGPQGRELRLQVADNTLNDKLPNFTYNGLNITNYEMESSAIYGLSALLGHNALTICVIIANRAARVYSNDHHTPMKELILQTLDRIVAL